MSLIFRYKRVNRPDNTTVKLPCVPITLCGKEIFDTIALLDSGADTCVMPKSIAEILGLELSDEVAPIFGLGGKTKSAETFAKILIGKGHEEYTFDKVFFKVVLGKYEFPVILGRSGFFDKFIVTFDQKNEKVILKKISRKRY